MRSIRGRAVATLGQRLAIRSVWPTDDLLWRDGAITIAIERLESLGRARDFLAVDAAVAVGV